MDPVGQARSACNACRRSALATGWTLTKEVSAASPKTAGAICRQASQSMQVESTKKSPGTFSGTRFLGLAMTEPPYLHFTQAGGTGPGAVATDGFTPLLPQSASPTCGPTWRRPGRSGRC